MKKVLITFSGLDGSGKSSVAKAIAKSDEEFRYVHMIHFRAINKISSKTSTGTRLKSIKKNNPIEARLNVILLVIDMIIFRLYYSTSKKSLVCDRYFYDLLVSHDFKYSSKLVENKVLSKLIQKPDVSFFIDVDPKLAAKRELGDKHTSSYFDQKRVIYERFRSDNPNLLSVISNVHLSKTISRALSTIRQIKDGTPNNNVIYITRPIAEPWDEASKNFTKDLVLNLKKYVPTILTGPSKSTELKNIANIAVYSVNALDTYQKLRLLKLRSILRSNDYNIVHFLFTPTKQNSFYFKKIIPKGQHKFIQTIATLDKSIKNNNDIKKVLFGDRIITYSNYSKTQLEKQGLSNITTIYPGIDLSKFLNIPANQKLAKKLSLNNKDFTLIYPGEYTRLGATKMLYTSLPTLVKSIPNIKLVFACRIKSDEDLVVKRQILEFAKINKLEGNIIHTGTVKDMKSLYNLADLVIFPVRDMKGKFDVPLAVIEAMACEKPVVITDLPVLSEFTNSNNAYVVKANSQSSYINSILELNSNSNLRTEIASRARAYVEKNFDIEIVAKQYEKLYDEMLGNE